MGNVQYKLGKNAYIDVGEEKKEVQMLDISIGGMRIVINAPLDRGKEIKSEFKDFTKYGAVFYKGKDCLDNC